MKPTLKPADFVLAAKTLNCEPAAIRAVTKKESSGVGFLKGQILTVRFEGHIFRQETSGKFDKGFPSLSHPYRRENPYNVGTIGDWRRLEAARKLAGDVAFECASYGMFQIMGFHYASLGYASAYAMVQSFNEGESAQLAGFVKFLKVRNLGILLRKHEWAKFALRYNGHDSIANNYGPDIQRFYEQYRTEG